jgi:ribosomal protein S21
MAVNVRIEAKRLPPGATKSDRDRSTQILLRIFKRACNEAGIMHDFKEHEFFIRPTDKKRRKAMIKARGAQEAMNPESKDKDKEKNNNKERDRERNG